jgi:ubiquinone/menaquinone biosynthesis C-methylase UbiE
MKAQHLIDGRAEAATAHASPRGTDSPDGADQAAYGAARRYDRYSRWYGIMSGGAERALVRAGLARLAATDGEMVVEIGPGPGEALVAIANAVQANGHVIGVDISAGMLRQTAARVRGAGCAARVSLVRGNAMRLPFLEGTVDAVFMAFTLELFDPPGIASVLGECQRILRPNGRLCVVALDRPERSPAAVRLYDWLHRCFPDWVDCYPIRLEAVLQASGLRVVSMNRRAMFGLPVGIAVAARADHSVVAAVPG